MLLDVHMWQTMQQHDEKLHVLWKASRPAVVNESDEVARTRRKLRPEVTAGLLTVLRSWQGTMQRRLVVPTQMQAAVLTTAHADVGARHSHAGQLLASVQSRFWWSGMVAACNDFVRSCHVCQRTARRPPPALVGNVEDSYTFDEPAKAWQMDTVTFKGAWGTAYFITKLDLFSGFAAAIQVVVHSALEARRALLQLTTTFGRPTWLFVDGAVLGRVP